MFYLDIIPAVTLGGPPGSVTIHIPNLPAHSRLPVTPLLIDTGAGQTILRPALRHLLQRQGTIAGVSIYGVNGVNGGIIPPQASGLLDFAFPASGIPDLPAAPGTAGIFFGAPIEWPIPSLAAAGLATAIPLEATVEAARAGAF